MNVLHDIPSVIYACYQDPIKPKPQSIGKTDDGQTIWYSAAFADIIISEPNWRNKNRLSCRRGRKL